MPSLHDEVLARLRDFIVEGNLAAGARVPVRLLCERFGISRTPLREALKVLASEGLIELLPNRGARVRRIDERELVDLFDVMGGLEALAGRLACERVTGGGLRRDRALHHAMYGHYLRRDLHGYFACNQAIHDRIVEAAGNAALRATYAGFAGRLRRVRYSANLDADRDRWARRCGARGDPRRAPPPAGAELADILFRHCATSAGPPPTAKPNLRVAGSEHPDFACILADQNARFSANLSSCSPNARGRALHAAHGTPASTPSRSVSPMPSRRSG